MLGSGLAGRLHPDMLHFPVLIQFIQLRVLLAPNPIETIVLIHWRLVLGVKVKLVGVVELRPVVDDHGLWRMAL